MDLRLLTKKDIPTALVLIRENYGSPTARKARRELAAMFRKDTFGPKYIVAEERGAIVGLGGYSQSWIDYDGFGLFWVNVQKDTQGRGIGTRIVRELMRRAKKRGAKYILIITTKPGFYRRVGFRKITDATRGYILMKRTV